MFQEKFLTLTLTWLGLHLVAGNDGRFLRRERIIREQTEFPHIQVPSEFGYSVQDKDHQSSHFRKEHRDENGVVRGSYGLRDPDGTFRLVRYIADEKGFRADVTSNEPGVGHQNPASVSVSKISRSQTANKDIAAPEFRTSNRNFPGSQESSPDYKSYNPIGETFEYQSDSPGESGPLDLRKYLSNYPFFEDPFLSKQEHPSSDVLWKDYNGNVYGNQDRSKEISGKSDEASLGTHYRNRSPSWHTRSDDSSNPKTSQEGLLKTRDGVNLMDGGIYSRNNPEMRTIFHDSEKITPGVLNIILKQPQQKVHRNLPDCGTVNSAVLCKPPLVYRNNRPKVNLNEDIVESSEYSKSSDGLEMLKPNPISQFIETTFADRLYKFSVSSVNTSPFRSLRNNIPLQSDVFRYFPRMKVSSNTRPSCSENRQSLDDNSNENINLTPTFNRPVIYNSISNTHINSYGENWRNVHPRNSARDQQFLQPASATNIDISKYNALHNKQLILLAPKNTQGEIDNSALKLLERLNVLGLILVPKTDGSQQGVPSETDPIETTDQRSVFSNKATNFQEENRNYDVSNSKNIHFSAKSQNDKGPIVQFQTSHKATQHSSTNSFENSETTSTEEEALKLNEEVHDSSLMGGTETFLRSNNSEFLILDDEHTSEKNDNKTTSVSEHKTETPLNWRKALEDELNGENQRTPFRMKSSNSTEDMESSDSNFSVNTGIPNERVYQIHDLPVPLYDSRGVPIKSENVPLHLHRYVPPTGVTSLPWKFAIPRPAPPRSIAIPPKPSTST